ncbi:MAG: SPFH domain-containing protein [Verrucomicrobiota bacterium]|jgi:membrane protease subunit HflC
MKRSPLTITIAFLLMIVFGLMLFVFQVRKSEVAVVTLFGKLEKSRVKTEPGAYLRWPSPIEKVFILDQRVHSLEDQDKLEQVALPDNNIILLQTYVGWRIEDPYKFFPNFENGSVAKAEETLAKIMRSAKLEVAGRHVFSDFLSADQKQMKLPEIENEIRDKARQEVSTRDYGIEIKFVQIRSIELPENNTQSVFDRMKSERGKVVFAIRANAEEQSTNITSKADSQAAKLLADADAMALEIHGEGEAAMVQSLQVLRQNPPLATFLMNLNMLESLSKDKTTFILDHTTPGLELLQSDKSSAGDTNAPK